MEALVPTMSSLMDGAEPLALAFTGLVVLAGTFAVGKWAVGFVIAKLKRAV